MKLSTSNPTSDSGTKSMPFLFHSPPTIYHQFVFVFFFFDTDANGFGKMTQLHLEFTTSMHKPGSRSCPASPECVLQPYQTGKGATKFRLNSETVLVIFLYVATAPPKRALRSFFGPYSMPTDVSPRREYIFISPTVQQAYKQAQRADSRRMWRKKWNLWKEQWAHGGDSIVIIYDRISGNLFTTPFAIRCFTSRCHNFYVLF